MSGVRDAMGELSLLGLEEFAVASFNDTAPIAINAAADNSPPAVLRQS